MRASTLLLFAALPLAACSSDDDMTNGDQGGGSGAPASSTGSGAPMSCAGVTNTPGDSVDMDWPAANNVGHDAVPSNTVHFHWQGSHNVVQVARFEGQDAPTSTYGDAMWKGEITSGAKTTDGAFDWNVGVFPCGYRPGIYFFVDEENPAGGIVSLSLTDVDGSHYPDRSCSDLADPNLYGGAYASYAERAGCMLHEVNNFQTEAHFDWVQPAIGVTQGDLVLFRWSGEHNVVQVHDVDQDTLVPGGITSGPKTNCVAGPNYSCVAGSGEYLFDSTDFRPGMIHISDECALACTGHTTGMNMEFGLKRAVRPTPPEAGACCAIDKSKGSDCRVVDLWNDNDGAQFDYNVPVGPHDLIRFRWSGSLQIVQTTPSDEGGSPSMNAKPGGIAMPAAVECVPGPSWSCLGGNTDDAEFVVDVAQAIANGLAETNAQAVRYFDFYGFGENTPGFTSADTGTLIYVDDSVPYDASNACP